MSAELNREPAAIDQSLVVGDLVFATPRDRCLYIGTSIRDRPLWLEEHTGDWRRIEGVQREAVSPRMTEPVATASEVLGHTEAAMNEADRPKTETTPPVAMRRKPGRSGGRKLRKQKLSAEDAKAERMLSPERMRIVLDSLRKRPILSYAATKAGIHRKTLEYWIKCSAAGRDGYDVKWRGETWNFHEHCRDAMEDAHDDQLIAAWSIAMGGEIYNTDQSLVDLGYQGTDAYLRDENRKPVVEITRKRNRKMLRWLLERLCPDEFRKNRKKLKNNAATAASIKVREWKAASRMIRKAKS